jgi:dTMP kinase
VQLNAPPARKGLLISFEGGEACGKSTQVEKLLASFTERNQPAVVVREPGGTPLGEIIRHLLKFAPESRTMHPETELLLFAASRAQLVREKICPCLAAGTHVICDRFFDSTTVYQGAGRQLDIRAVNTINDFATGTLRPDITILLDLPVDVARSRLLRRPRPVGLADRMELLPSEFYETVRAGYLALATAEPERFVVQDATPPPHVVFEQILAHLQSRYPQHFSS